MYEFDTPRKSLYTIENFIKAQEMDEINYVPRTDLEVKLKIAESFADRFIAASVWAIYSIHRELGKSVLIAYTNALESYLKATGEV